MRSPNDKKFDNFYDRWDWLTSYMVVTDLFVHNVLMLMEKRMSRSCPTMGVGVEGTRLVLYYNPDFIDTLSDAELRFIITHEIYHVIFHHITVRLPEREEDRELYNIAADMAINCLIPESPERKFPKDKDGKLIGVYPAMYKFEEKLSMEQYLQLLKQKFSTKGNGQGQGQGPLS